MSLLHAVLLALLSAQPFGNIPFTLAEVDENHIEITLLQETPTVLLINDKMELLEINHEVVECTGDVEI